MRVAAVIDSRNVFHQVGDTCGVRCLPSVTGVVAALRRYGLEAAEVYVGLALPRVRDAARLSRSGYDNEEYRKRVVAEGGSVLLGELHHNNGFTQEKMVDVACAVRVTQTVQEIRSGSSNLEAVVVLSQDSDLTPAYRAAEAAGVTVILGGQDAVQYRGLPYVLLGPHAFAEMCPDLGLVTGHEVRMSVAASLAQGGLMQWEVVSTGRFARLKDPQTSMTAVPAKGYVLPPAGTLVDLYPVGVEWREELMGAKFAVLVVDAKPASGGRTWAPATVVTRLAPLKVKVATAKGASWSGGAAVYPLGGVVAGDQVLVDLRSHRVIGPLSGSARNFDADTPSVVRVLSTFASGGALVIDQDSRRGLLNTTQGLAVGDLLPAVQLDEGAKGPVWAAIGTPLKR